MMHRILRTPRLWKHQSICTNRFFSTNGDDPVVEDDLIPLVQSNDQQQQHSLSKPLVPEHLDQVLGIPIARRPLFPGFYKTLTITSPKITNTLTNMLKRGNPWIGVFLQKDEATSGEQQLDSIKNLSEIHPVGVFAQLINVFPGAVAGTNAIGTFPSAATPTTTKFTAIVFPHRRIKALELASGISKVKISNFPDEPYDKRSRIIRAISQEIFAVLSDIAKLNSFFREHIMHHNVPTAVFEDPAKLADFVAVLSSAEPQELQQVLEAADVEVRLRKALELLKKELVTAQLQHSISKDVENKLSQKQREYFLHEQLKVIKKELGLEADTKDKLIEQFKERAASLTFPPTIAKVFAEELGKLSVLEPNGSEFNVTRNYLDWITQLPWGKVSNETLDYANASTVLEADHYGLEDVKNRILEFIAVGKLKGTVQGKILCLVGPPGVGKTSIGKSIARALNRSYYRFSVGGLSDVAEIKGHRRTYVGAMPGKIIQALKSVQSENPLILIDEIDKIGHSGHQGDPSSALLELLDPEQNKSFLDHYLDLPVDLSKVLFVCTANVTESIPGPLLDRMEVLTLSGYIGEEKKQIASRYLIPNAQQECGITAVAKPTVTIQEGALDRLIKGYCRENGVRNLKKHIEKIYRKAAFKIVSSPKPLENIVISEDNLTEYVGQPPFSSEKIYPNALPVGVVMGLAWTALGGSVLYVETVGAVCSGGKDSSAAGSLFKTGQLGKVMDESSSISYTYVKDLFHRKQASNEFFATNSIHLHVPEGAIPKDGPSAGVTMATALCSLALGQAVKEGIAMTGELTLTGKVLRIGGLREKTIAAKNSGVKEIIFPKGNLSDWEEFPAYIRDGLKFNAVEDFEEIFSICFGSPEGERVVKE